MNVKKMVYNWVGHRFSMDSGYYAGRGPTRSDLNSDLLEKLYQGIRRDLGKEEAANFVRFVNNLDNLSASAFIVAFEKFLAKEGKVAHVTQELGDGTCLTGHGEALEGQAFSAVASVMFDKRSPEKLRQEHEGIKDIFIRIHEEEIPDEERKALSSWW